MYQKGKTNTMYQRGKTKDNLGGSVAHAPVEISIEDEDFVLIDRNPNLIKSEHEGRKS